MSCSCGCCGTHNDGHSHTKEKSFIKEYGQLLLSGVLLAAGIASDYWELEWFQNFYVRLVWYTLAYLPVGLPVLKEAVESMMHREYFNEFTLMTIATLGAFYIGEYPEGVAVMLFYSLGELFQDRAVDRAKKNIEKLIDVRPETATLCKGEQLISLHPDQVSVGDILLIRPGERISLDGKLLEGAAHFDTSALTGESVPREIEEGGEVLAGMIVTDRVIKIEVNRPYNQSTLARILELVEHASEHKAPAELFIRKFARVYTPAVTLLALLIVLLPYLYSVAVGTFEFVFDDWLYRALVFLVISCPCALVVSIPLGYFGGIGTASRMGILFKGSNYLDRITQLNTVVFDKTGTLTKGKFEVQSYKSAGMGSQELLQYAASAEQFSSHPIAAAIVEKAGQLAVSLLASEDTEEIAGYGIRCKIDEKEVLVGKSALLERFAIPCPDDLGTLTETVVVCAVDRTYAGCLLLADSVKPEVPEAIRELKKEGIRQTVILSGDRQSIVTELAAETGIDAGYGDLLPADKVSHLEKLKAGRGTVTAFVGDGMNDAPALAISDIGIAMGGLGSDAAIETADVVIQNDSPSKVATAIRVGKATRRIVWENIGFAFAVKLIILILGALGMASLWEAVFADVGVAFLAILNAVRLQITYKE